MQLLVQNIEGAIIGINLANLKWESIASLGPLLMIWDESY